MPAVRVQDAGLPWGRLLVVTAITLAVALGALHAALLLAPLEAGDAPWLLLGILLGGIVADLLTGGVHWACDTWGDEHTPWLGHTIIYAFREHHAHPRAMLDHDWASVNREPGVAAAAALVLLSLPAAQRLLEGHCLAHAFVWSLIAYGAAANQLHRWAHMERAPVAVRLAQRLRLVLPPHAHARHHCAPHTGAYCIATGWLNPLLDRAGFWRALERAITRTTGAVARADEHDDRRLQGS